jgi:serine/threonine protein kinase
MGEVYVARQRTLDRLVAIKFLKPEDEPDPDPQVDLARFRREAELMAKVSHPHILSLFDFGEVGGRAYLVMAYVEEGDLRRRMCPGRPMPIAAVRSVLGPVGDALSYLHRQGIIHRDLKPENILLREGVSPLVTDFGVAVFRAGSGSLTRTGRGVGTLGYVAPEQQYRLKVDERADQYSLAAMAYEMLTGQLPLGIFKPPSHLNPVLTGEVDAVILRALQENPKDRFATVRELTEALDRALEAGAAAGRGRKARRWLIGAGSLLTVMIAAVTYQRFFPGPPPTPPPPPPATVPKEASPPAPLAAQPAPVPETPRSPTADPKPDPGSDDPLLKELKALVAYQIWKERGSPGGTVGGAVKDEIWFEASRKVEEEVNLTAYEIWRTQGSPKGEAGERVRLKNQHEAERRLYKAHTGKDYSEPAAQGAKPEKTPP